MYAQSNKFLKIFTPLGEDALLLTGFTGREGISMLFRFRLDLMSLNPSIDFKAIMGQNVTVSVELPDGGQRYFNGIISRFRQNRGKNGEENYTSYDATLVPSLWLLDIRSNYRIFQNRNIPDIVSDVLKKAGISHVEINTRKNHPQWEYCVQYGETDFNFISRLMEEEGIYYFFEHSRDTHKLIITDDSMYNPPCPHQESASYIEDVDDGGQERDMIDNLSWEREIRPTQYTALDYDYLQPNTRLQMNVPLEDKYGPGDREIYYYPAGHETFEEGWDTARLWMEEDNTRTSVIDGESDCRAFTAGYRFLLEDYYRRDMNNKEYLLTSVKHDASQSWGSGEDLQGGYSNSFSCIPYDIQYRPKRSAIKPKVYGSQTAFVVGPEGEEIYTDQYGRIKVQFHWDREGKKDENSSCWIRVSQPWAGKGWGFISIPRIGHEVVVDFIDGDPDRPIVTGSVYHSLNRAAYALPDHKTRSTLKSNSTIGGGGFNELRFEDKKEQEEIFIHGQKDWNIIIENDKGQKIGHDETLDVVNNRTKTVGVDQSERIGKNKTINVGENHDETIGKNKTLTVQGDHIESIKGNTDIAMGGELTQTVTKGMMEKIGDNFTINIGKNATELVGDSKKIDVGGDFSTHAVDQILVLSNKQIRLESGSATVIISSSGEVTINGSSMTVKSAGEITMKGSKVYSN